MVYLWYRTSIRFIYWWTNEFYRPIFTVWSNGDSTFSITNASTPWVVSQKIAPWQSGSTTPTRFELFRIHTIADGTYTNTQFKVEISNVKLAGQVAGSDCGSFTLHFVNSVILINVLLLLNNTITWILTQHSANFIARIIGDRYNYINFNGKVIEFGTYHK